MRAPQPREVTARFLDYLQDHIDVRGVYSDPDLRAQAHCAEIGAQMHAIVRNMVRAVRWSDADIDRSLGEMLSEPRQHAVFEPPRPLGLTAFARAVAIQGVRLDMKSRLLFDRRMLYMNGEAVALPRSGAAVLKKFADERALPAGTPLGKATLALLHRWHAAGYLQTGAPD
jgi:50S ribosomal protein L16 3-hydroxylase